MADKGPPLKSNNPRQQETFEVVGQAHPDAEIVAGPSMKPGPLNPYKAGNQRGMLTVTPATGSPTDIEFQYNPAEFEVGMTGTLYAGETANKPVTGAPEQTINLKISIEATAMAAAERNQAGIRPQLAQLEMLLYPDIDNVTQNQQLLAGGKIEAVPEEPPKLLLTYGNRPPMPVKLKGMTVTERLHDGALNPIVADVSLQLEAVTYSQVPPSDANFDKFLTYHRQLKQLAQGAKTVKP